MFKHRDIFKFQEIIFQDLVLCVQFRARKKCFPSGRLTFPSCLPDWARDQASPPPPTKLLKKHFDFPRESKFQELLVLRASWNQSFFRALVHWKQKRRIVKEPA